MCVPETRAPCQIFWRVRSQKDWYIPVGRVLRAWLAAGRAECHRQLPTGGEAAWCWAWGTVRGRAGLMAVAGLLRLPPPGWMVVAIPFASGDPPTTLFRSGPAPPKGALRKQSRMNSGDSAGNTTRDTDKGLLSHTGSGMKAMQPRRQILKQHQDSPCRQTVPRAPAERAPFINLRGATSQCKYSRNSKRTLKQRNDSNQ